MISYKDLVEKHHWEDKDSLKEILSRLEEGDGLLLYENHDMWSSCLGRQHLVIMGPTRTIPSREEAPSWIDPDNCGGLPSRREQLVDEVDVEDLRRCLDD